MLNLIQNEWMKIWQKKSSWITIIVFIAIIAGMLTLVKVAENTFMSDETIAEDEKQLQEIEAQLADPSLTEAEREDLEVEQEMMMVSIESSEPSTREGMVIETYGMMALVTLMTIIVSSGIVSAEFSQGTIKMLLARPVKRWKILLSKYITVLLYSLLLTVILFVVTYITSSILFPKVLEDTVTFSGGEVAANKVLGKALYMMFLGWINTVVISTLAFMIGTIFRSTSLAIGISIFLYFTGNTIVLFLTKYDFAKYILFANTDLTQYETGYVLIDGLSMSFSATVIAVYAVLFLLLSFLSFIKRDVAA
ncbi:MAG TPA: ABC transporter permease subunit [Sporosarcina sp.]|nr:ABC transporter permease subunit [Sporosarcina sp.]